MRNSTKINAQFISLVGTMPSEGEALAETISDKKAVETILYINSQDKYWTQKKGLMKNPLPNMGIHSAPSMVEYAEDIFKEGEWPRAFVAFMLKVAEYSPRFALYVEDGPFGFAPVFSVRLFRLRKKSPYLIKFGRNNLSDKQCEQMLKILYSKNNVVKHVKFRLKEIEPLSKYEY